MTRNPLLDVPGVASYLNIPPRSARQAFNERRWPIVHVGRRLYVRQSDLDEWVTANTKPARLSGESK